jgi:hypothetical protein
MKTVLFSGEMKFTPKEKDHGIKRIE